MIKISRMIRSIPKVIYGAVITILAIIDAIAFGLAETVSKISIDGVANFYDTLTNLCPSILMASQLPWLKWVLSILIIFLLLLRFYRERLLLIEHKSMANDLAPIGKDLKKQFYIKKLRINQVEIMRNGIPTQLVIEEIDKYAIEIQKKQSTKKIGYYGIAHTPLIFRLGFKIGDQSEVVALHRKRNNNACFEEWTKNVGSLRMSVHEKNKSSSSEELIVAVSTSLEITECNISSIITGKLPHILFFKANNLGFDVIESYVDAENLRNVIWGQVRDFVKMHDIKRIYLVLATSVGFTFFLGQAYSEQHDPELTVFHYQNGKYTWGINMSKAPCNALVIHEL